MLGMSFKLAIQMVFKTHKTILLSVAFQFSARCTEFSGLEFLKEAEMELSHITQK